MSPRENLRGAIKAIAWGYILLHLDINLGTLNILPNWLAYLLMVRALPELEPEQPSAGLLRPLGLLLAAWEGVMWLVKLLSLSQLGADVGGNGLSTIAAVIALYFHFQLLTDLAQIAQRWAYPNAQRLLRLRTARTILATIFALPLPWEEYPPLSIGITLVYYFVLTVWISVVLFSLHSWLRDAPYPLPPELE